LDSSSSDGNFLLSDFPGETGSHVADKKSKNKSPDTDPGTSAAEPEISLGKIVTEARERKGLTREQVVVEAHLPAHYVKMIETDSYGLISDQLYLVPFLRRYAAFLGLDAEDVASRFVRDVQHAEANVVRMSQEITMVTRRRGGVRRIAIYALVIVVLILLADFAYRRFLDHRAEAPAPVASPAAIAPGTLPPATIDNNPERAEPPAAAPSAVPPASIAPPSAQKAPPSSAPRPIPVPATD
ncbi:MAG TPA: helix-turn-helix transcriptional regulator, partial [Sporolactobacillaceae bacterium]|nr:helix-turn-helix transcriptional regulator [Sporolactobacillaceae bacterium]